MPNTPLNSRETRAFCGQFAAFLSSFSRRLEASGKALIAGIPKAERRGFDPLALKAYVKLSGGR